MLSGVFPEETSYLSYHDRSPFLFWTMACTGARHFHNADYFRKAANKVRELVGTYLLQIHDPIPTIQAILILCLWPLPVDSMWKDPSHALAGAAMQLAVQNGLHKVKHEQDFRKTRVHMNGHTTVFRARLWLHCVILFQRFAEIPILYLICLRVQNEHLRWHPVFSRARFRLSRNREFTGSSRKPTSCISL
jgi:hypothetical protein